jgi:hypothetical protein
VRLSPWVRRAMRSCGAQVFLIRTEDERRTTENTEGSVRLKRRWDDLARGVGLRPAGNWTNLPGLAYSVVGQCLLST